MCLLALEPQGGEDLLQKLDPTAALLGRTAAQRYPWSDGQGCDARNPAPCRVLKHENLLDDNTLGFVSHVEAKIPSASSGAPVFSYVTGDHIGIFPSSHAPDVDRTLHALGADGDQCFRLKKPSEISGNISDDGQ